MTTDDTAVTEPRWRLQAWDKKKTLIHDGTCVGDRELNDTLAALERRPDFKRSSVTQEAMAGRQTVTAEVVAQVEQRVAPCRECNRLERDCRAIPEAVSGHTFESSTL